MAALAGAYVGGAKGSRWWWWWMAGKMAGESLKIEQKHMLAARRTGQD